MSKLDSSFWSGQAETKSHQASAVIDKMRFISNYFNDVCYSLLKQFVGFNHASVLKVDLWNESVSTEREVLRYFQHSQAVGTDISNVICKGAYAKNKVLFVSQGDIRQLPFKDKSFQVILDISTIDHVSEADAIKVIVEYSRLLSDGGILFLMYAQKNPFAIHYWNKQFAGVYLLNSRLIGDVVAENFAVLDDRGLDFLHSVFGLGPKRLIERFLIWHCPTLVRKISVAFLYRLERSPLSQMLKGYCGLRLTVAVKGGLAY